MSNIIPLEKVKEETFVVSPESLIGNIVTRDDFCEINGKIEPTRDLALKLFAVTKIEDYSCDLQQVVSTEKETVYIVKATVKRQGKKAEGFGACSTIEIDRKRKGDTRSHHDALAVAETRAFKRALEAVVGLPFINEIILKLFGGYETPSGEKKETPQISPEDFIFKLQTSTHIKHMQNVWNKYRANLKLYDEKERKEVIKVKEEMKKKLSGGKK